MKFYKELIGLSDEELEKKVRAKIAKFEEEETEENILGYHLDYNPKIEVITEEDDNNLDMTVRCFYNGYIKEGTKMVYGALFSTDRKVSYNDGRYYYIDNNDYIIEFCKYIRNIELLDEYELFGYILEFLRDYYGYIENLDREEMFKMILSNNNCYYAPVAEHKLSDFKGKANAMCSEYSIMAQNILSVFDITSYLIIGQEKTGKAKSESHAFNIVSFTEEKTAKKVTAIVDFANYVKVYNIDFEEIGIDPFIAELEEFNDEILNDLLNHEAKLEYEDYSYLIFGNELLKIGYDECRSYYIQNRLIPDEVCVRKKVNN